ncbi:protamine 2 [Sigmodon hispidus]
MGGHTGATTTTDTVAARVGDCTGSIRDVGHAGGEGDTPAATGGGIAEAAKDPGGGDAGAGSVGGTTTKPPQAHLSCLEPRKSPAQGIATCPNNITRGHSTHRSTLMSES